MFGGRTEQWAAWQAEPWGRLRYAVAAHTTSRALAGLSGPLRIVDVGGGDGADSLPLARAGHDVTILNFSGPLLHAASAAAEAAGVGHRVRTVCADLDDLAALHLDGQAFTGSFDAVLCHNVVHHRPDVPATVTDLVALLRPGGVVSVMAPNPAMDVLAAAVRRADPEAALDVLDADTVHSRTFDHPMRRVEAATVEVALQAAGCVVEHHFGIRCVMDLIADDDLKRDPAFYERLERLELALCEREPYRRTARFWQLTARRR
ncbi:tRNA uridine 5-oxyacetic acid(34) methyltransferase CmoM [Kineococcus glutinatus]|uniref:tRNA uridine 5-oxyacetic acid(34) methyltransferase CmoM n=1 Tax=Kineococcus glutinatus TaxID=1070872 RepID=A0ABP9H9R2_9ACTN